MSRNRATLITLMLCGFAVLAATAPVQSRGGVASEIRTLNATSAVQYDTSANDTSLVAVSTSSQNDSAVSTWYATVRKNADADALRAEAQRQEAAHAAEHARQEAARRAARAASPPPPATPHVDATTYQRRAGNCGGWEDLIAAYFPNEVGTACRVMMCESGGSPTIHNSSSTASGLWQFLDSTWYSTTGTPGPAANYSAETQTAAAAKLRNSSGWSQWQCY